MNYCLIISIRMLEKYCFSGRGDVYLLSCVMNWGTNIAHVENVVKENKDILTIIALLGTYAQKELGLMCESRVGIVYSK